MVNPVISEKHPCVPVEGSTNQIQRMDGKGKREKENHETMKPILLRAHQRSELEVTREIHDAVGKWWGSYRLLISVHSCRTFAPAASRTEYNWCNAQHASGPGYP